MTFLLGYYDENGIGRCRISVKKGKGSSLFMDIPEGDVPVLVGQMKQEYTEAGIPVRFETV